MEVCGERWYMKEKWRNDNGGILVFCCCMLLGIPVMAENLSDDFSVETDTDADYAEDTTYSVLRGNNLNLGNLSIKKLASNKVIISGLTQCHHSCDIVYLNMYLERKVNGTYSNI